MRGNGRSRLSLLPGQSVASEDKFKYHTNAKSVAMGNHVIFFISFVLINVNSWFGALR